jgi:hypothetical protein
MFNFEKNILRNCRVARRQSLHLLWGRENTIACGRMHAFSLQIAVNFRARAKMFRNSQQISARKTAQLNYSQMRAALAKHKFLAQAASAH